MSVLIRASFEKLNYLLRPAKQIQRRLLLESFQQLALDGFDLSSYRYLGFGSPYYVDFVLFHRTLGISSMLCIEREDIPRRMEFNKPFRFVDVRMQPVSEIIAELGSEGRLLVWLDYDEPLDGNKLDDIDGFCQRLNVGSILLVTVRSGLQVKQRDALLDEAGEAFSVFYGRPVRAKLLQPANAAGFFEEVIRGRIDSTLQTREDVQFVQMFDFRYADGAQMLSVGGMICDAGTAEQLRAGRAMKGEWIRADGRAPTEIKVPLLTVREKLWLEQRLHETLTVADLEFELEERHLEDFKRHYRQYPSYTEVWL